VSFAREGVPLFAIAALVAAGTYALALNRRSWQLWLLAFAFTIAALWVAYFISDPPRRQPAGARTTTARVESDGAAHREFAMRAEPAHRVRSHSFAMDELNVPADRNRVIAE
jgi:uncharacterized membrane protein